MTTSSRWSILLLWILLELVRHISMCSIANSTSCLPQVSVLIICALWKILWWNSSRSYVMILWAQSSNISRSPIILRAIGSSQSSLKCIWWHLIMIIKANLPKIVIVIVVWSLRVFGVVIIYLIFIHSWVCLRVSKIVISALISRIIIEIIFFGNFWVSFVLIIIIEVSSCIFWQPYTSIVMLLSMSIGWWFGFVDCDVSNISSGSSSVLNWVIGIMSLISSISWVILLHQLSSATSSCIISL